MSYRGFRGGGGGRWSCGGGRQFCGGMMGNGTTGRSSAPRHIPYGGKPRPRGGRAAMDFAAASGSSVLSRLGTVPAKSPAGSGDVWYKVLIPHGKKCDKKYLLESLMQLAGPFVMKNFHFEGNSAIFLVNGRDTANALRAASGKFRAPNGFKVTVITMPLPNDTDSCGGWNKSNSHIGKDEHKQPAAITFEIDALSCLLPTKGNYFANEQVQNLLVRFLNQYFTLYDADNREKLLEAYHENAILSMNVGYNQVLNRQTNFEDYFKENRNLLKAPAHKKDENLKKGRLLVVAFLAKLPLTTHDPNAFTLDVVHVSATSLIFTVYGVFKERLLTKETNKLRTFSRTFVAVPQGDGIVIANELYHITNASPEQQELAFKQAPTPLSSPAPVTGVSMEVQLQMVRQFAIDSTMNEDWSRRCLEQNVWDYQKAAACFTDLQAKGAIPAEAFQK